jgi:HSP20 family protein
MGLYYVFAMGRGPFEWDEDFQRLGERVDDFFDRVFGLASTPRYGLSQTWRPSADVYRVADGVAVVVELPGVEEADLKVVAEQGRLRIAGHRRTVNAGAAAEPLQLEIDYGPFERIIALPAGAQTDRITAEFRAGLLTVHVPVRDQARSVQVRVTEPTD